MEAVRPLTREDVPAVVMLYQEVMQSGSRPSEGAVAERFEEVFLDGPLSDPEIPSLVHEDSRGRVIGFIGSHVRRMLFDGRPARFAYSGQLVIDPRTVHRTAGAVLMKAYMEGPQDATLTDGATETVRRIWEMLGGEAVHLSCMRWTRILRPLGFCAEHLGGRLGISPAMAPVRPLLRLLDGLIAPLAARRPLPPAGVRAEPATPGLIARLLPEAARFYRLRPDYDEERLEWLFREMAGVRARGDLRARLLRGAGGRVLGWYVYYLKRGGVSAVAQVVAARTGVDAVLDHLLADAHRGGAAALQGRVEPLLLEPLSRRGAVFQYRDPLALVHSRDPEILLAIQGGKALLTRMDGEWWAGTFRHVERSGSRTSSSPAA